MKKFENKLASIFSSIPGKEKKNFTERFNAKDLIYVEINKLKPNKHQPREHFDDKSMEELKASIEQQGLLQPIIVKSDSKHELYEIIAGERRFRAAKMAGLTHIPVLISHVNEEESAVFAIIENVQRQNLHPLEEAQAYDNLINEFKITHEEVSKRVGKSRSTITNLLRILELPAFIKEGFLYGKIQLGHAKVILSLDNLENREKLFNIIIQDNLSVRECEKKAKAFKILAEKSTNKLSESYANHKNIEMEMEIKLKQLLKTSLSVKVNAQGKVIVTIANVSQLFNSLEKLSKLNM